jgi:hypothetical protein
MGMHKLILGLQIVLIILFVLNTFIWLIAHGSGHNIPLKTDLKFGIADLVLISLTILIFYLGRTKR